MLLNLTAVLAAIAAETVSTNNAAGSSSPTLAQRFQSSTGLPAEVGHYVVNIIGALIILASDRRSRALRVI